MKRTLEVGQIIYRLDGNYRIYKKGESGADFESHFRPFMVVAEDATLYWVSYLNENGSCDRDYRHIFINKRSGMMGWTSTRERDSFYTQQEKDDALWIHFNRYRVEKAVGFCKDAAMLKKIDEMVTSKPNN